MHRGHDDSISHRLEESTNQLQESSSERAGTGGGVTSADCIQEQRYRASREVSGQERSGPADEVHLQRLRKALRQQQRHPAPVARKGFRRGGSGVHRTGADCEKICLRSRKKSRDNQPRDLFLFLRHGQVPLSQLNLIRGKTSYAQPLISLKNRDIV
ncbi:Acetylornithine deacetylase [Labeo rohita]|uniref:Acetylornithine deacetylase n=1 Tax=Labeo rohita TaxID=84645 RepID=A0ABQ8MHX5_LABRO|nr:Acetylornithine deacetylase [Labeo rohita]